jgi:hypothetical protein
MPGLIYFGSFYGIYGIAWSLSIFMVIAIYPFFKLLITKMIPISFPEYLKALIPNYKFLFQQFGLVKK